MLSHLTYWSADEFGEIKLYFHLEFLGLCSPLLPATPLELVPEPNKLGIPIELEVNEVKPSAPARLGIGLAEKLV